MVYRGLADAVMLGHFGFLAFVALGGFLAWRYRWVLVPHLVAVAWGVLTVSVGLKCPLTAGENALRRLGGGHGLPRGFIDTYLTGVVYPQQYLPVAQLLLAALVVVSWAGVAVRSPAFDRLELTDPSAPRRTAGMSRRLPGASSDDESTS